MKLRENLEQTLVDNEEVWLALDVNVADARQQEPSDSVLHDVSKQHAEQHRHEEEPERDQSSPRHR